MLVLHVLGTSDVKKSAVSAAAVRSLAWNPDSPSRAEEEEEGEEEDEEEGEGEEEEDEPSSAPPSSPTISPPPAFTETSRCDVVEAGKEEEEVEREGEEEEELLEERTRALLLTKRFFGVAVVVVVAVVVAALRLLPKPSANTILPVWGEGSPSALPAPMMPLAGSINDWTNCGSMRRGGSVRSEIVICRTIPSLSS